MDQAHKDNMHALTKSRILFLCICSLMSVKIQAASTCAAPVIENGLVLGDIKEYNEHEIINYECNPQYKRVQELPSRCTKNGDRAAWIPTPECEEIKCELILPPLRGTTYEPAYRNRFSPGETVTVTCEERYWVVGTRTLSVEITCKENGQWTVRPVCQEVTCSHPQDRVLSYWEVSWRWGTKKLGDTVRYTCISGYKRKDGVTQATCTRDGWEPNPLCQEIQCRRQHFNNADITGKIQAEYRYNDRVQYNCRRGYEGSFTLTCREDGWYGSNECTANQTCSPPPKVENAVITTPYQKEYPSGFEVTYQCFDNYITEGKATINCIAGEWEELTIKCLQISPCGIPPALEDGDTKTAMKEHYSHNETVEYMCQSYYIMEGEPYKTCLYGEWTGHMRCLRPCIVNENEMSQHNITLKSSGTKYLVHDDIIEFRCTRGLPMGNVAMRQRCNSGVLVLPTCRK